MFSLRTKFLKVSGYTILTLYGHIKNRRATVIGTLAVDAWAVTVGTALMGYRRAVATPSALLAVPNVTIHPSTASVPHSCCLMWHYNCLCALQC